jgi:ribosomal protein L18E
MEKRPPTEEDLASFEGKYPKDLFNKSVIAGDNQTLIGHVAKETDDLIVVFSESDNSRFDIPKSQITLAGGSVVVNVEDLSSYKVDKDAPLPESKSLRPSAEEIRTKTAQEPELEEEEEQKQRQEEAWRHPTRADALIKEGQELAKSPRPATVHVSKPEKYTEQEAEILKKFKRAANELKEIIIAGAKIAEKKVKEKQQIAAEKQAEGDAEKISKMGELAMQFTNSFEDILSEIRTRKYAEQEQIYNGFLKLIDQQRELIAARRDLAVRLKESVQTPVVQPEDIKRRPKTLKLPRPQPRLTEKEIRKENVIGGSESFERTKERRILTRTTDKDTKYLLDRALI